jgi:hypothetical protein
MTEENKKKKKHKFTYSRGDAVLQKNRPVAKGLSRGEMDKVDRRVNKRIENNVPFDLWDHEEQMFHVWYNTGEGCPSSVNAAMLQVTELRKRKDIPDDNA